MEHVHTFSIPNYALLLLGAFLAEMKKQYVDGNGWLNYHDLDRKENMDIKSTLFGEGMLFDCLSIDKSKINAVQQYEWKIEGDEYQKCRELAVSEYVQSPRFAFIVDGDSDRSIHFHFNFYGRMSFEDKAFYGIFVEIDQMPEDIKAINIEVDIKCNEKKSYRQLLRDQKLTQKKRICGFRIFTAKALENNSHFEWTFGVKIFNLKIIEMDADDDEDNIEDMEFDDLYQRLSDL